MPLIYYPNPLLKMVSEEVKEFNEDLTKLVSVMYDTMSEEVGCGLAAVQIGVLKRVIVIDLTRSGEGEKFALVNPKIVNSGDSLQVFDEGCLSVPDVYFPVERPETIELEYFNEHGEKFTKFFNGFLGTAIQHEIDHLNGIVFVDHLSKLKQNFYLKKYKKRHPELNGR